MLQLDEVKHQVQGGGAARGRVAIAIDAEHLVVQVHARKLLAQRRQVLPVDGRLVVIEQSRACQRIAAGTERAEPDAALRQAAQHCEQGIRDRLAHVDAAADEQDLDLADLVERDGRGELESAARRRRPAVETRDRPLVNVLADHAVGHAQDLERVRDRDQRVVRQRQEGVTRLVHARPSMSHLELSVSSQRLNCRGRGGVPDEVTRSGGRDRRRRRRRQHPLSPGAQGLVGRRARRARRTDRRARPGMPRACCRCST